MEAVEPECQPLESNRLDSNQLDLLPSKHRHHTHANGALCGGGDIGSTDNEAGSQREEQWSADVRCVSNGRLDAFFGNSQADMETRQTWEHG